MSARARDGPSDAEHHPRTGLALFHGFVTAALDAMIPSDAGQSQSGSRCQAN
jgi:hypothetical protein